MQIGACGTQPAPVPDVAVEGGETLLAIAVDVVGEGVAGLLHGAEKGLEERARGGSSLQDQGAVAAAEFVLPGQAVLHALEIGQTMRVVPLGQTRIAAPPLIVQRVAPLEDHAVDAAGAAQNLAAAMRDPPVVHVRLRLGAIAPVVVLAADGVGERRGHVDEEIPPGVGTARFQDQHPLARLCAQPVGQDTAG